MNNMRYACDKCGRFGGERDTLCPCWPALGAGRGRFRVPEVPPPEPEEKYTCGKCGRKSRWFILLCTCSPGTERITEERIDNWNRIHEEHDAAHPFSYEEERDRWRQWLIDHTGDGHGRCPSDMDREKNNQRREI